MLRTLHPVFAATLLSGLALLSPRPAHAQEAASSEALPQSFEIADNTLKVPATIVFETAKATLKPESDAALRHVVAFLAAKSYVSTLRVEVHTDNVGDPAANLALSRDRAVAVVKALVAAGADCKRLLAVGFGDTKPRAANATPEGRAENRRVEFHIAALRDRPIGGMPVDGGAPAVADACTP